MQHMLRDTMKKVFRKIGNKKFRFLTLFVSLYTICKSCFLSVTNNKIKHSNKMDCLYSLSLHELHYLFKLSNGAKWELRVITKFNYF